MSGRRHGPGQLGDLYEAAGRRRGEQRAMIVLGVAGLALAMTLAAYTLGGGFADRIDEAEAPVPPATSSGAQSLVEAALGEPALGEPARQGG